MALRYSTVRCYQLYEVHSICNTKDNATQNIEVIFFLPQRSTSGLQRASLLFERDEQQRIPIAKAMLLMETWLPPS